MSLWLIPIGLYVAVSLALLGAFVFDEMGFRNPEYGIAVAFAVGWPFVLGFALLKQFVNWRRSQ